LALPLNFSGQFPLDKFRLIAYMPARNPTQNGLRGTN
jgi:hypothetical protein